MGQRWGMIEGRQLESKEDARGEGLSEKERERREREDRGRERKKERRIERERKAEREERSKKAVVALGLRDINTLSIPTWA